jgi:hypothetical protein
MWKSCLNQAPAVLFHVSCHSRINIEKVKKRRSEHVVS